MNVQKCHSCSYQGICQKDDDTGCNQWSVSLEYLERLEENNGKAKDLLDTASVVLHVYSHGSALSKEIRKFLERWQ